MERQTPEASAVSADCPLAYGFLTAVDSPVHGIFGGYLLVDPLGRHAGPDEAPDGIDQLRPAGVVEGDAEDQPGAAGGLLEEPQYTRPAEFRGWEVPEVLRSGDHARIERWRQAQALHRTLAQRPDLVEARGGLSESDRRLLEEFPSVTYP